MADERDERLGTLLSELEVPEHGPGFWADLERLLADESPAGAAPELPRRRFPIASPGSLGGRIPRAPRREPGTRIPRLGFALAAVAVIAAVAIVAIRSATVSTQPARAAEIVRQALDALGSAESISGTLVVEGPNDEGGGSFVYRKRFLLSADGSFRGTQLPAPSGVRRDEQALDAPRGVAYDVSIAAPGFGGPLALKSIGVSPGGPDQGPLVDELDRDLGATALALIDQADARVREITYKGRPAWELDSPIRFSTDTPGRIRAVIDMQTAIPVESVIEVDREPTPARMSIRNLEVNVPVEPAEFRLEAPPNAGFELQDFGFRRTNLAGAAERAGFAPPRPGFLPAGFVLDQVAVLVPERTCVAECDPGFDPTPTGIELRNPVAGAIVVLSYRSGLRQFAVTARPTGPRPELWQDPFVGDTLAPRADSLRLAGGRFSGARGEIVIDPLAEPHLWAVGEELVVTVGGSLTRADLIRVAESIGG